MNEFGRRFLVRANSLRIRLGNMRDRAVDHDSPARWSDERSDGLGYHYIEAGIVGSGPEVASGGSRRCMCTSSRAGNGRMGRQKHYHDREGGGEARGCRAGATSTEPGVSAIRRNSDCHAGALLRRAHLLAMNTSGISALSQESTGSFFDDLAAVLAAASR